MVLYNEDHPNGDEIDDIVTYDLRQKPDMLIIMGTTLSIPNLRKYVKMLSDIIHKHRGLVVWIDKDERAWKAAEKSWGKNIFDHFVVGDIDEWCNRAALYWRDKRSGDWDGSDQIINPKVLSRYGLVEVDMTLFRSQSQMCTEC